MLAVYIAYGKGQEDALDVCMTHGDGREYHCCQSDLNLVST
jgi:hypothetical protein